MKECLHCKLVNPDGERCDCGCEFPSQAIALLVLVIFVILLRSKFGSRDN